MEELAKRQCTACRPDTPRLRGSPLAAIARSLGHEWELVGEERLRKSFRFPDFARALAFIDKVGAVAERESHHPDLHLSWGRATVEIWTHAIGGLSENDFILAAKIEALPR